MPYSKVRTRGHNFYFKIEEDTSELLHIFARHRKEPRDAINIFFNGSTNWNPEYERFETQLENEMLYWIWFNEDARRVLVISCFSIN